MERTLNKNKHEVACNFSHKSKVLIGLGALGLAAGAISGGANEFEEMKANGTLMPAKVTVDHIHGAVSTPYSLDKTAFAAYETSVSDEATLEYSTENLPLPLQIATKLTGVPKLTANLNTKIVTQVQVDNPSVSQRLDFPNHSAEVVMKDDALSLVSYDKNIIHLSDIKTTPNQAYVNTEAGLKTYDNVLDGLSKHFESLKGLDDAKVDNGDGAHNLVTSYARSEAFRYAASACGETVWNDNQAILKKYLKDKAVKDFNAYPNHGADITVENVEVKIPKTAPNADQYEKERIAFTNAMKNNKAYTISVKTSDSTKKCEKTSPVQPSAPQGAPK